MHDKTNTTPESLPAQKNKTLQDRYDSACMRLENNCFCICCGASSSELLKQNAELQDEIKEIRKEAAEKGIVLLSAKRLL